jgi:hypothetical protein
MLPAAIRYKLHFGPYRTPRFKVGSVVQDKVRGRVKIIGVSNGRIPWPVAMNWTKRVPIVYGGLAKALRLETLQAVAYWWGGSAERFRVLRRKLGIPMYTAGMALSRKRHAQTRTFRRMQRKAWANAGSPKRRQANSNGQFARYRRMSKSRASPGTVNKALHEDGLFRRWTAKELALLPRLSVQEIAERTGRTRHAVYQRRKKLLSARR